MPLQDYFPGGALRKGLSYFLALADVFLEGLLCGGVSPHSVKHYRFVGVFCTAEPRPWWQVCSAVVPTLGASLVNLPGRCDGRKDQELLPDNVFTLNPPGQRTPTHFHFRFFFVWVTHGALFLDIFYISEVVRGITLFIQLSDLVFPTQR